MDTSPVSSVQQDSTSKNNETLREDLVKTAVKFLQSPKVRETPVLQQKTFLAKKGLTETEIEVALARVEQSAGPRGEQTISPYHQTDIGAPPRPLPVTWRDYATAMMFVSGASFVAYRFVRRYVLPAWFNVPDPEQERLRRLDEGVTDVQNGLKFLVDSVQQTLGVVQQQQETLNRLVNQLIEKDRSATAQERTIQELKNEIATIKSLLLSRDQFPPLPTTTMPSAPVVPAWQMALNARQPTLVNGNHTSNIKRFHVGSDGDGDDQTSTDGLASADGAFLSADGSENGERMTPV